MKLMVDIKKAVQEYDLDAGTSKNFLVFNLGGKEHRVEATDDQLQQAIYDARVAGQGTGQNGGHRAHTHEHYAQKAGSGPLTQHLASIEPDEEPEEEPSIEDIGAQLLAEGHSEDEVLSILMKNFPEYFEEIAEPKSEPSTAQFGGAAAEDGVAPALFEDFSGQPTDEEMAEFMAEEDQMPDSIDISSDDISGGGTLEAVIAGPHEDPDDVVHRHPRTGQILSRGQYDRLAKHMKKPHIAAGRSDADKKAALRARAARVPKRSVSSDDAGNPIAPQVVPPSQPVQQQRPVPTMPGFEDDGFSQG